MNQPKQYPNWFLWLWERGVFFTLGSLLLVMLIVVLGIMYVEQRLTSIQDRLQTAPPSNYLAPDLNEYAVEDKTAENLPVRRVFYVPTHSHIYHRQGRPFSLEVTLSIRNTDQKQPIYISAVEYYNARGERIREYVDQLIRLKPLENIEFLVEATDTVGGSSATFLVSCHTDENTSEPMVEAVMVGTIGTQGIAFSTLGRPLGSTNE